MAAAPGHRHGRTGVGGDSTYDIEAAAALGWQCIAVRTGGFGVAELAEAGAVAVFADVAELLDHLDDTLLARPTSCWTSRIRVPTDAVGR